MKKVFAVFFGIFVMFSITGCMSDTESNNVTDTSNNIKTNFIINETAIFKNVHYTVTDVEYSNGDDWDKPSEGKNYVIVTIKIENNSDSNISYNSLDWKMTNSQGQISDETFTTIDNDTNLSSGELSSGGSIIGTIVFEQPINDNSLTLSYYNNSLFDENSTFDVKIK